MGVILRERKLKDGRTSYFLDISHEGKRRYEFLNIHVKPIKGRKLSDEDKLKREAAEKFRASREYELIVQGKGIQNELKNKESFLAFMDEFAAEKKQMPLTMVSKSLRKYLGENTSLPFSRVNVDFLTDFQKYLLSKISHNTARQYMICVSMTLNHAVHKKIILANPMYEIPTSQRLQHREVMRTFLTVEELRQLAQAETQVPLEFRQAFLLGCFTGLRYSDLHKLKWNQIVVMGEGETTQWVIQYRMQKTRTAESLPLAPEAVRLIEQRREAVNGSGTDYIFPTLVKADGSKKKSKHTKMNEALKKWAKDAEVNKHLHFHAARHTFATMAITSGNDPYVVGKLLGHRSMTTTQIYAKIVDRRKNDAVNTLPSLGFTVQESAPVTKEPAAKKKGKKDRKGTDTPKSE